MEGNDKDKLMTDPGPTRMMQSGPTEQESLRASVQLLFIRVFEACQWA